MIAAGEVVQRPASVVKELVENAVDAGASKVHVIIKDAGRTLIQVIDDGCGMSPSEAVLCFERHATSKIDSASDLDAILTYGFRGEALASIAAVSQVTLRTRREKDETAVQVVTTQNGEMKSSSVLAPKGSNFAVRDLFYNTPARRKFLKSDNVELKHITEEFVHVAISHPDVSFILTSNDRDVYNLKAAKSLKFRILDLLGSNVVGDVVDIDAHTSILKVSGFVGRPDTARKTLGNQYFFVNGRYFRSPYLHKAVMKAYEELIPEGVTPSYFIFLEVDPHAIDINIHPTKTEVKFEEEIVVFQTIYACVKEVIGRNSFGASIDFDTEGAVEMPQIGSSFAEYKPVVEPQVDFDPTYDPFSTGSFASSAPSAAESRNSYGGAPASPSHYIEKREDYGKLFEERMLPSSKVMILQGRYVLTPVASGLMIVNIARARERILYEQYLKVLESNSHVTQAAMFPVQVQVGVAQRMLFDDNAQLLSKLGFDIAPFGNDTIVVNGVPEGYSCEEGKIRSLIGDIQLILSDGVESLSEVMTQRMAERFATLGASNAMPMTSPQEGQKLIDTLFTCSNTEVTSNGRNIISILPAGEIDKRF